jgi:hypothetical protein
MTAIATRTPLLHSAYDRALAHSLGVDACALIRARLWQAGIAPGQFGAHLNRLGAACMPGGTLGPDRRPVRVVATQREVLADGEQGVGRGGGDWRGGEYGQRRSRRNEGFGVVRGLGRSGGPLRPLWRVPRNRRLTVTLRRFIGGVLAGAGFWGLMGWLAVR